MKNKSLETKIFNGRLYTIHDIGDGKRMAQPMARDYEETHDWKARPELAPPYYVIDSNDRKFEVVSAKLYVEALKKTGAEEIAAEKSGAVIAHKAGRGGEDFITYTSNGNTELSSHAEEGEWILTRAELNGQVAVDENGHDNSWVMKPDRDENGNIVKTADEKMAKKYDMENMQDNGFVKPNGGVQEFIRTDRDVAIMVPWGEGGKSIPQTLCEGSVLNETNLDDIYGIAADEFEKTYSPIEIDMERIDELEEP